MGVAKRMAEAIKLWLSRRADGFFAYTSSVKEYLIQQGLDPKKLFVVNNTIDILEQRRAFDLYAPQREAWRAQHGLVGKDVLLFVGRFMQNKRLDFLFRVCSLLEEQTRNTHLLLVGSGNLPTDVPHPARMTMLGPLTDVDALGPIYTASDLFVYPGQVGLGPVQALCYGLPIVTIQQLHKPEFAYLSTQNSLILPKGTSVEEYAAALLALLQNETELNRLRENCWPSIRPYTVAAMAQNFIEGIDAILHTRAEISTILNKR
jgi:glycosyltransferase involved in cell wall biosynthesis